MNKKEDDIRTKKELLLIDLSDNDNDRKLAVATRILETVNPDLAGKVQELIKEESQGATAAEC